MGLALILVGATVGGASGGSPRALQFTQYVGPMGITKSDTARLSFANLSTTTVTAQLVVIAGAGNVLKKSMVTLGPGAGTSITYADPSIIGRLQLRGQAKCSNNLFSVSLGITDTDGDQIAADTESPSSIIAPTDAYLGPVGLTINQSARLNVTNTSTTQTQTATLSFFDVAGALLQQTTVTLLPRASSLSDWTGKDIVGLRGQVTIDRKTSISNLEVYDVATGRTVFLCPSD